MTRPHSLFALLCLSSAWLSADARAQSAPPRASRQVVQVAGTAPARPLIEFGRREHVERLANELSQRANRLCAQMDHYYRENPDYANQYREMYGVYEEARHIRDLANRGAYKEQRSDDRIAKELHEVDRRFHQSELTVRNWKSSTPPGVSRRDVVAMRDLLEGFNETLRDLMEDYGEATQLPLERTAEIPSVSARVRR